VGIGDAPDGDSFNCSPQQGQDSSNSSSSSGMKNDINVVRIDNEMGQQRVRESC
jgi:hypothetical protein